MQLCRYVPPWLSHLLACMGGCLGSYPEPKLIVTVDEPAKGRNQGRSLKKSSVSEDFWSTSTCEMDISAIHSLRNISSISMPNQCLDPQGCGGSMSNPSEFINHGLLLWNQTRLQWLGNKRSKSHPQVLEPRISWNATYESLLTTNKPFPQPIPLPEMIDFLVDIWDQEGLYD
ncbi:hypothetical protein F2P56_026178 [Juglans regia]|uniref:Uncharacterized protein LOC108992244 isoform X1 n=2 Tax=Juglans regia TaxID=51240 RepID=A0A2I4ESB0_JUGRE|nr:uncharacterized protein LOC108992244 isoform X1 [Juglans regia]XP_018822287.1 uncharacterized protein LOC108992244 isoform X1 [Juglans regia]KAF5456730.1 hypothetical protein F2P56_026178 [Juglans regia]